MKIILAFGLLAYFSRTFATEECGGTFSDESGEIVSSEVSQDGLRCQWKIEEPKGKSIFLNFDDFEIKDGDCVTVVYTGRSVRQQDVCDDDGPKRFMSRGDIVLTFESTGTSEASYVFKASYSIVDDNDIFEITDDAPSGVIDIEPGYVASGKRYTIRAPEGKHVRVDIEDHCVDYRDGYVSITVEEDNVVRFDDICSRLYTDTVYASKGNELDIVFQSHNDKSYFKASFESFECGGDLPLTDKGEIASPYFPEYYPNGVDCLWNISAPAGKYLFLSIDGAMFREEPEDPCPDKYIIYNDKEATEEEIRSTNCDDIPKKGFWSHEQNLLVRFVSNENWRYVGFHANIWVLDAKDDELAKEVLVG